MTETETVRKRNKSRRRGNNLNGMRELVKGLGEENPNIDPKLSNSQSHIDFTTAQLLFAFTKVSVSRNYSKIITSFS